ncbi:hypothetical protein EYF80_013092 [Liparis tanakae]|uniref:Uncharacterized protein n=1 Tax=Liparis tanakae TaxID=230148 RepID=A0A4Z2IFG0_9TELE|nr:hypothetical protein EYF80_013092 [Liparis tanakae]
MPPVDEQVQLLAGGLFDSRLRGNTIGDQRHEGSVESNTLYLALLTTRLPSRSQLTEGLGLPKAVQHQSYPGMVFCKFIKDKQDLLIANSAKYTTSDHPENPCRFRIQGDGKREKAIFKGERVKTDPGRYGPCFFGIHLCWSWACTVRESGASSGSPNHFRRRKSNAPRRENTVMLPTGL